MALVVVPAIAAATSQLKIGFNSVLFPVLPPYQWAKYLSTLDVMTDGRVICGAAMGWWEEDFTSVGVPRNKRGKLFTEQLEVITRLWTEERVTFEGEHYQLRDMPMEPKPIQKPYPPIWIGGGLKSIWRTAKYGECVLCFWPSPDDARQVWVPKLQEEGAKYGTDPKLATFTFAYVADGEDDFNQRLPQLTNAVAFENPDVDPMQVTISGSPERCAERIKALSDAGVLAFCARVPVSRPGEPRLWHEADGEIREKSWPPPVANAKKATEGINFNFGARWWVACSLCTRREGFSSRLCRWRRAVIHRQRPHRQASTTLRSCLPGI